METIGTRIAYWRQQRDLSQAELARRMRLRGHRTISQPRQAEIEVNTREVKATEIISFARILRVPITTLLGVPDFANES
jgi:transcriptional regulator with XRE-family HTH domain